MTKQQENETFFRNLIVEVEAAAVAGMITPQAIADHFNANGNTSRKGRRWTSMNVAKLLNSPGVERSLSNENVWATIETEDDSDEISTVLHNLRLRRISKITIGHYDRLAADFWYGTRNHYVSQNYEAFLKAIEGERPYAILDLGCGPGRDLHYFRSLDYTVTGLDGSKEFVTIAQTYSGCEVFIKTSSR